MLIPIILGSPKDSEHGNAISSRLQKYGLDTIIRICSAHKYPERVLEMLYKYNNDDNVPVLVTIAGKSNALSALIDGNVNVPVISCPPLKHETMYDLYSSVSMPTDIAPLLVLKANNAALAVLKLCGLVDKKYKEVVQNIHNANRFKLKISDLQTKYDQFLVSNKNIPRDESSLILGELVRKGKIRDIYNLKNMSDYLGMVATDRLSSFDKVLTTIPYKGMVLNKISNWWFNQTSNVVPNHVYSSKYNKLMIVKKCQVFPIEFVVRSYMTGSTQTSIWQNYLKGARNYCGHKIRDGYKKNDKLDEILLTPTTKSDVHDELISEEEILKQGIMTREHWNQCKEYAMELFKYGQELSDKKGLILVDTKYEFGLDKDNNVLLIDEVHTPDSSRFWFKHSYEERTRNNLEPENIDKDIIRKWVKKNYKDPYNTDNIEIPDDLRYKVSSAYLQLHELITGKEIE